MSTPEAGKAEKTAEVEGDEEIVPKVGEEVTETIRAAPPKPPSVEEDAIKSKQIRDEGMKLFEVGPLDISVSDPLQEGSWLKKYTTYLLYTPHPCGFTVRRRYSDFQWLRELLKNRYPGICVPPLPAKNMNTFSNTSKDFIEIRRVGLQLFVTALVSNAYFRNDPAVMSFIKIQQASKWAEAKKSITKSESEKNRPISESEAVWRRSTLVRSVPSEGEAMRILNDVHRQLIATDGVIKKNLAAAKKLIDAKREVVANRSALIRSLSAFHDVEKAFGDPKKVEYVDTSYTKQYERAQEDITEAMTEANTLDDFDAKCLELLVMENLRFYDAEVVALQQLIEDRERTKGQYERSKRVSKQAMLELKRVESDAASPAEKLRKVSAHAQESAEDEKRLETRLHLVTSAIIYTGFEEASDRKIATIKSLVGMINVASEAIYAQRGEVWEKLLTSVAESIASLDV